MRLLAISGSLRSGSYNMELLRAAAAERPRDVEFVLWNGLGSIPAYDEDLDVLPPPSPSPSFVPRSNVRTRCSSRRPSTTRRCQAP